MPRERTGSIRTRTIKGKKVIYARVTYIEPSGKRKSIERRAESRSHAKEMNREILKELDERGHKAIDAARMTFAELAEYFSKRYLIPPNYVSGRKVAGRRTHIEGVRLKNVLVANFGAARIRDITHGDLERFKTRRLNTPTKDKTQRAIASVNRELSLMRRILNVAVRETWLRVNPFNTGDPLISVADEVMRERILSRDEEARLLAACEGKRAHLKAILICALDTGMRQGEIFSLKWSDVDLTERDIHIQAFNTKTMKARSVSITKRLAHELAELWDRNKPKPDDLVFGILDTVKRSFKTACQLAGITGFRFHDCRHMAATRLVQGGMPLAEVARVLGHSLIQTTFRYVNATPDSSTRAVDILDRFQEEDGDGSTIN